MVSMGEHQARAVAAEPDKGWPVILKRHPHKHHERRGNPDARRALLS